MKDTGGVSGGQVSGGKRSESDEWDEWRQRGLDAVSYKHVIAEAIEGGLDSDRLWSHNSPKDAMYPSNETVV
jgi:hypothetical protein